MENTNETQGNEIIDLGFDINEADVARPVLQGGTLDFTIAATRREPSKQKQIPQLIVVFKLAEMAKDTQGRDVNPGFTLTQRYLTQPTGGMTQEMIKRNIGQIQVAAAGAGRVNTEGWIGKTVRCSVRLREAHTDQKTGKQYGESNEISAVFPKK